MEEKDKALKIIRQLAETQNGEGGFTKAKTSVTRSSGKGLAVETTSMALIAFLRSGEPAFNENIERSVEFLVKNMNQGYWGSTQSTILAMRALIEFQNKNKVSSDRFGFDIDINGSSGRLEVLPESESSEGTFSSFYDD